MNGCAAKSSARTSAPGPVASACTRCAKASVTGTWFVPSRLIEADEVRVDHHLGGIRIHVDVPLGDFVVGRPPEAHVAGDGQRPTHRVHGVEPPSEGSAGW